MFLATKIYRRISLATNNKCRIFFATNNIVANLFIVYCLLFIVCYLLFVIYLKIDKNNIYKYTIYKHESTTI